MVRPLSEVMSAFAPDAAALIALRAPAAVVAPVPPWPRETAVVRPVRAVMSEFEPEAAALIDVRADAASVPPVPP